MSVFDRDGLFKRYLPRSLFGRAIVIIVTPVVLVQLIIAVIFYDRHLEAQIQRMARAVGGDLAFVRETLSRTDDRKARQGILDLAQAKLKMVLTLEPGHVVQANNSDKRINPIERLLVRSIARGLGADFAIHARPEIKAYVIHFPFEGGAIRASVPNSRFTTATAHILAMWLVGASILLLAIAILFLRNQVRPIRRLAEVADRFGKGQDVDDYRPSGAAEVRQAGAAFLRMSERIRRQIRQRTEMLAGVSHDLKTPLTRMRLGLAMLNEDKLVEGLAGDIDEMEQMIEGYLAFARGAQGEAAVETDVSALLHDVVAKAGGAGKSLNLEMPENLTILCRPMALRRCVTNLLVNATLYGGNVHVGAEQHDGAFEITVDDDGPGIPAEHREDVFRPFFRLDRSRNLATGGVGLGLAIARDAVRSHGGDVSLASSPAGGLRAIVRIPI